MAKNTDLPIFMNIGLLIFTFINFMFYLNAHTLFLNLGKNMPIFLGESLCIFYLWEILFLPRPKWSVPVVPWSVHCRITAGYLTAGYLTAEYTQTKSRVEIHCHLLIVYLHPTFSVHCCYTEAILPIHSTSVWVPPLKLSKNRFGAANGI